MSPPLIWLETIVHQCGYILVDALLPRAIEAAATFLPPKPLKFKLKKPAAPVKSAEVIEHRHTSTLSSRTTGQLKTRRSRSRLWLTRLCSYFSRRGVHTRRRSDLNMLEFIHVIVSVWGLNQ